MAVPLPSHSASSRRVAIFASGAGSNAQKIIDHFRNDTVATVALVVSNNPGAGVLHIAAKENIPFTVIERKHFYETGYLELLREHEIELIVLAGFLWKVPGMLIGAYHNKIINIHPALLPKFGGKNMYGQFVHEAVIRSGEKESGITIHYVDEIYDHGKIIFQTTCRVEDDETPQSLAEKIHRLEHKHYPQVIKKLVS